MAIGDLDHRAAAKIDAEIEPAGREKEDREQERHGGDHVEREREPHERNVALDSEEFHVYPVLVPLPPFSIPAGFKLRVAALRRSPSSIRSSGQALPFGPCVG